MLGFLKRRKKKFTEADFDVIGDISTNRIVIPRALQIQLIVETWAIKDDLEWSRIVSSALHKFAEGLGIADFQKKSFVVNAVMRDWAEKGLLRLVSGDYYKRDTFGFQVQQFYVLKFQGLASPNSKLSKFKAA